MRIERRQESLVDLDQAALAGQLVLELGLAARTRSVFSTLTIAWAA